MVLGALLTTTGIGMSLNVLFNNFFDVFESKTMILAKTITFGALLIWVSCGIWLLILAYTSSRIETLPHIEDIKEFLAFASKEIEEQIKTHMISKEDEEKLKDIVKLLNRYLSKEVKYSISS
jgi:ABC-type phosphate/phosphonate transport system substrate-binding protein